MDQRFGADTNKHHTQHGRQASAENRIHLEIAHRPALLAPGKSWAVYGVRCATSQAVAVTSCGLERPCASNRRTALGAR
jgi:hypothetical protein